MSIREISEINEIILDEIEKLKIPNNEKKLLVELLQFEKENHNKGKQTYQYQDQYKAFLEKAMLKREK